MSIVPPMVTQKLEDLISENVNIFRDELTKVIKPSFTGLENPTKYSKIVANSIYQSDRDSLLRQARLEAAGTEYIENKKNKSLILSSEMGTGKCILPNSNVIINGQVYTIEEAYSRFADKNSVIIDDENPFAQWYKTTENLMVASYDEHKRKIISKNVTSIYKQKISEVIRKIKTAGKYTLETTKVHKYLTPNGWTNNIKVGDYIAIPKNEEILNKEQNIINPSLLAWLLGEGCFQHQIRKTDGKQTGHSISFSQKDKKVADIVYNLAKNENEYSITRKIDKRNGMHLINLFKVQKLVKYLKWGVSKDKEIPNFLMQSNLQDIRQFLAAYIDAEGSINVKRTNIEITTASKKMAYQLSSLLRKIEVVSTIEEMRKCATNGTKIKRTYYRVSIGGSSARELAQNITPYSIVDYKKQHLFELAKKEINNNIETIYMFDLIKNLKKITGLSRGKSNNIFANVYLNGMQKTVNKRRAYEIVNLIESIINGDVRISKTIDVEELNVIKDEIISRIFQEIFFVPVKEITEYSYDGYVYDLSVEGTHNFIAQNILVHNTSMAIKISMSNKLCPVYFVACPPHLVQTWKDELEIAYKDKNSYRAIVIKRWEDLVPYSKRLLWNDGVKYYFLIARESLKLSYPKKVAVKIKKQYITQEEDLDGQTTTFKTLIDVAKCPKCNCILKEEEDGYLDLDKIPLKCECGEVLRTQDKSVSKNLQTREAIADFIFKRFKKGSYNVILDEMHEYKGGNTGQGNAMARLVSSAKKVIGLTGTLMNGYASSLFYILYRLNPHLMKVKLGFDYNQVKDFVSTYGAHEEIVEAEVTNEGIVTRMGKRVALKEKPKISPYLLSVLLECTIFLRLDEIKMPNNLALPDYTEIIDLVPMEEDLRGPYISYLEEITSRIRKDKRLLGNLATDAIAIPDMPFTPRSAQEIIHYNPKFTREEFGRTNKEKRLVSNVAKEMEQNRKCLIFITFSNQIVATDITEILTKEFPGKIVKFLPSTIPAAKRKAWIEKNPCDILICNPELVKTGLTLLQFPTIIFYETTYNVFTLKQASRRSWRIGQKQAVKVIFMAYEHTPQHKALELIGAKVAAANSLEGRLSGDDDLSSMGDDDDNIQIALAKSILNNESSSNDIKMTTIKNFGANRDFDPFELYYQEQLDIRDKEKELPIIELEDIIDIGSNDTKDITNEGINLILEDNKAPIFTMESMMSIFAQNILRDFRTKDVFGGIKDIRDDKIYSTSYNGAYQLFEINKEYKDNKNKVDGITVSYKRDDNNYVTTFNLNYVYYNPNKAPFEPKCKLIDISMQDMQKMVLDSKDNINELADLLLVFVMFKEHREVVITRNKNNEIQDDEIPTFDSLLQYDGEITSNTFVYYKGKGKKKQRIEVDSDNMIASLSNEELTAGVQLSLF